MKFINCYRYGWFLLISILGCTGRQTGESIVSQETNIVDKIKLKDMDGKPIDLNDYRGNTVFINFWATWCAPCIEEMPSIEQASTKLKDKKVKFLLASNEDVSRIRKFIEKRKLDLSYVQLQNLEELNILSLPTTFIIDPSGKLVFSETGYRKWDEQENIELITKTITNHE